MKKSLSRLPLAISLATLAGCSGSFLETKKVDYKSATVRTRPLEVPPDLTAPARDARYSVPDLNPKSTATYSSYNADRAGATAAVSQELLPQVSASRIERAGSQRWLVVSGDPQKLWSAVRDFWLEAGFILSLEMPEAGILETDWAENRAKIPQDVIRQTIGRAFDGLYSTAERDKFRTRLEKGPEGTTEIYISHRGVSEIYASEGKDSTVWQPRPADPELEAEMISRLMVRLGVEEQRARAMLTAVPVDERARLSKTPEGGVRLVVEEGFDRAWRRVGLALDRVGFTVEDRDRSLGMYFVRYVDPDIDSKARSTEGVFTRMMSAFKSDKSPAKAGARYRIHVVAHTDNESRVQVLTQEGGVDQSDASQKILTLLREQLK
jgi:outer membrane protein assembly factor BamC